MARPDRRTLKVWFHRARAAFWVVLACLVFPLGWEQSIGLVILASLYANVTGDWGAAEAADDRDLVERLDRIEAKLTELLERPEDPPSREVVLDSLVENGLGFRPESRYDL